MACACLAASAAPTATVTATASPGVATVAQSTTSPRDAAAEEAVKVRAAAADAQSKETKNLTDPVSALIDAAGKFVVGFLLPLTLLGLLVAYRTQIGSFLTSRAWSATLPGGFQFNAQQAIAAAQNRATVPSAADLDTAAALNGSIQKTVVASVQPGQPVAVPLAPATIRVMNAALNGVDRHVFKSLLQDHEEALNVASDPTSLFAKVSAAILESQLTLLKTIALGGTTVGDARKLYAGSAASKTVVFDDWLAFLVRFKLIDADPSVVGDGRPLRITPLGKRFVESTASANLSATLISSGRSQ